MGLQNNGVCQLRKRFPEAFRLLDKDCLGNRNPQFLGQLMQFPLVGQPVKGLERGAGQDETLKLFLLLQQKRGRDIGHREDDLDSSLRRFAC